MNRTPLYNRHLSRGARIVDFAGWEMPVQYGGILEEHRAVRENCGIFDISHMGEFLILGREAASCLDSLLTNSVTKLEEGQAQYSLLLNQHGGIIDDLIVYRTGAHEFLLIVNAAKIDEDFTWLRDHIPNDTDEVVVTNLSDAYAAMAIQGPRAPEVFSKAFSFPWERRRNRIAQFDNELASGGNSEATGTVRSFVATTGYTGEAGFEVLIPAGEAMRFWDLFVDSGAKPCGLGARDTLRLEMCYPLNGSDLSGSHTPLEAGLGAFVDFEKEHFTGRDALIRQKDEGIPRRLAAIRVQEKSPPIRAHYAILANGEKIAETTSGVLSPTLGCGIALGYLPFPLAKIGQDLEIEVRGRLYRAGVVKKPFYQPRS
jgi:glycine cleavage system T protein (aminomethyltransferase)